MKTKLIIAATLAAAGLAGAQMFAQMFGNRTSSWTPRLPVAYQEVEYLESTGTQYIATTYYANQNSVVTFKFSMPSITAGQYFFGARTAYNNENFSLNLYSSTKKFQYNIKDATTARIGTFVATASSVQYVIVLRNGVCTINGVTDYTFSPVMGAFSCTYPTYIFALNNAGTPAANFTGKIYGLKTEELGIVKMDYIPCYRKSDNVIGMYDVINNTFETNDGTGSFTAGPDVD